MYFIDYIYEKNKKSFKFNIDTSSLTSSYKKLQYKANIAWFQSFSPVMDILYFQIIRQTECAVCNKKNLNFENQSVLEVDIKDNESLSTSINRFFKPYYLEDWTCDKCNIKSKKNMIIQQLWFLPKVLIFCIKRFKFEKNKMNKLKHSLDIPFTIDMKPYCLQQNITYNYRLSSVINHLGTSYYGHYNCDLLNNDEKSFIKIDDDVVIKNNISLNSQNCYILFYEQITG
jgi:ubiquitin C-terminal hydrolase